MGIKIVVGVLLIVALLVTGLVWFLSRATTAAGKPTIGDGSIFTPKPGSTGGSGASASENLGTYLHETRGT